MNEKSSIKELIEQLRNNGYWVRKIVSEYLGVDPEDVVISVKDHKSTDSHNFT